jgi:tetratricopeptide (TPR) repeat protein
MHRIPVRFAAVVLVGIWPAVVPARASASDEDSVALIVAAGRQALLERHLTEAVRVFRKGLNEHPADNRLRLELGRAYFEMGEDGHAIRLFREILRAQPEDRATRLELAGALGFRGEYQASSDIYRDLLGVDAADEAAAIGLASNLLHEKRPSEARGVVVESLLLHSDSLRLQEYRDRIDRGTLWGEEREGRRALNQVQAYAAYFNDSNGNHSWRSGQRMDLYLRPGLSSSFNLEENLEYRAAHTFEAFENSAGEIHWKVRGWMVVSAGAGAVRFNDRSVQPTYQTSAAFQLPKNFIVGGSFSRIPVLPNGEATEHKITARGWETFGRWNRGPWQVSVTGSRQHYSDQNLGTRETVEGLRDWRVRGVRLELGYRYRHYGFDNDPGEGYFAPDSYQSHLAVGGVRFQPRRWYHGEVLVRGGFESIGAGGGFSPAWEINVRNEVALRDWTMQLDYARYHLAQETGAFRADTGQLGIAYHF